MYTMGYFVAAWILLNFIAINADGDADVQVKYIELV